MNIDEYFNRIHFQGSGVPTCDTLNQLYYQHVTTIPFENINSYIGIPFTLSLNAIYEKIIKQHRGGGCYELNGLFHQLLARLGFAASLYYGKFYIGKTLNEDSLHAIIKVSINNQNWYLDVSYGADNLLYPLKWVLNEVQSQENYFYRFTPCEDKILFSRSKSGKIWKKMLLIYPKPVELHFFEVKNRYHQENKNSRFTNNIFCSIPSFTHRKLLVNNRYTCRTPMGKIKRMIKDVNALHSLLTEDFNLKINLKTVEAIYSKINILFPI